MPIYEYEVVTKQTIQVTGDDRLDADRLMMLYMVGTSDDRVILVSEQPSLPVFVREVL